MNTKTPPSIEGAVGIVKFIDKVDLDDFHTEWSVNELVELVHDLNEHLRLALKQLNAFPDGKKIDDEVIGAFVDVVWCDDETKTPQRRLISFGEYDCDEEPEFDSVGLRDEEVFFHSDKESFFDLYKQDNGEDFYIVSHSFVV